MKTETKTKKSRKGLWIAGSIIVIFAIYFISTWSSLVSLENDVEQLYKEDQSIYSNTHVKIMSAASVAKEYSGKIIELVKEGMTGRFGDGGSNAAFQWFRENNITISQDVYIKVQQLIESGYNEHKNSEAKRLKVIKILKDKCEKPLYMPVAAILGYPRIDLDKYESVIMTEQAQKDFETKTMKPINPFDD